MDRVLQDGAEGLEGGFATEIMLPVALAIIMLGMGMELRTRDFAAIARGPRGVAAGLLGQLVLLPLAGIFVVFLFVLFLELETELAVGLLLLAAVPGGATSNLLTWLSRGDTALSVSLTAITSVGSFLLTPAVLFASTYALWGEASAITVPFIEVLKITLAVVAGPVVVGMLLGTRFPRLARRVHKPLRVFSIAFLALLIVGIIVQNREGFWGFAAATVPAALALNLLALAAGFAVGRVFRLGEGERRAVAIEVGFQNGTFGIVLALTQLESARAALMPGFYSLVMYVTGGFLASRWARRSPTPQPPRGAERGAHV